MTGAYKWDIEYRGVGFGSEYTSQSILSDDLPEEEARFYLFRNDPVSTSKMTCAVHARSLGKVLVQIMSFMGSMLGLRAFVRTVIITMGEKVYRKLRNKPRTL